MTARRGNCHFNSRIDVRFGKGLDSSLCLSQQGKGELEWTAGPRGERGRVAYLPAVWRWREASVNFSLVTEVPRCSCLSWTPHSMKSIPTKRALGYIPRCWEWDSKEVGLEQDFLMSRDRPWRTPCRVSWQIHTCSSWENEKLDIFSRFHIMASGAQRCALLSCVRLLMTSWTVALQVPLSMGFSGQEYWSRLPFSSPGHTPDQVVPSNAIQVRGACSLHLKGRLSGRELVLEGSLWMFTLR